MAPFNFIFNQGNREKSQGGKSSEQGGWGMTVMMFLVKNSPVEIEVRRCIVAKVLGEVLTHFHAVTVKRHSSMNN
jgi:hypothetical protein